MDTKSNEVVLLLEDQALIAVYVEGLLQEAGLENVATYSSCAAATQWLQQNRPKLAIIETKLRDGACDGIASLLAQMGIPFIVHSAERDVRAKLGDKCRWIDKPSDPVTFVETVKECASS